MTDKDVERNVRSSTLEGIQTPSERHLHGIGEKHTIAFGEKSQSIKKKEKLLDKFRSMERKRKGEKQEKEAGGTDGN
jgi:hypothetical protein